MKIELDIPAPDRNIIESYSSAGIIINKVLYQNSIIIRAGEPIEHWPPASLADLQLTHFDRLIELAPELVLLGTGRRLQFPPQEILASLISRQIGMEVMDSAAACRAYNFIAGEGRKVVAAMLTIGS
jgi:uncharacterized protein